MRRKFTFFVVLALICTSLSTESFSQVTEAVSSTFNLKLINKEEVLKQQQEELKRLQAELTRQLDEIRQQMIDSKQLSTSTELNVKPEIERATAADGSEEVNLKLQVAYETKKEKEEIHAGVSSRTDDFASGAYKAVSSKACMMACNFLKEKAENELADYFEPGGRVTIKIIGETDASKINGAIPYKGEYGEFEDELAYVNGIPSGVTITKSSGITSNGQLAFLRAKGVQDFVSNYISNLQRTQNIYQIYAIENEGIGNENRRISVEMTIHGAFNKIVNPTAIALEQGQIDTLSDVDKNIPVATQSRGNYLALIIANERYENWAPVSFASNDGKMFKEYCIQTLGIPESQVKFINNASTANMGNGFDWLVSEVEMLKGVENPADKRIIVYYAGHGYPVREGNNTESYLIPVDCNNVTSGKYSFSLADIYDRLGALGVGSLTFFLDACFSGSDRSGAALVEGTRGIAIAPKAGALSGNTVVFSAVKKDQTAHPYRDKRHGMFTYYLLKAMQESEGDITYGELSKSVESNVIKTMIRDDKGLVQNPTTDASSEMKIDNKWQQLKF